jgi:hypothetical protein
MVKTKRSYRKRKGGMQQEGSSSAPSVPSDTPSVANPTSPPASSPKKGPFGISMPKLTLPNFTMGKFPRFFTKRTGGGRRKGRKGKRKTKRKGGARRSRKKNKGSCENKYK